MMRHSSQADFDVVSGPAPGRPRPVAKAPDAADSAAGEDDAAPPGSWPTSSSAWISR